MQFILKTISVLRKAGKRKGVMSGGWRRTAGKQDNALTDKRVSAMKVDRGTIQHGCEMNLLINHRMIEVHRVAKLAVFLDDLLRVIMRFDDGGVGVMLVAIQYHLPRDKYDQQQT
jgi:hypothetical protein